MQQQDLDEKASARDGNPQDAQRDAGTRRESRERAPLNVGRSERAASFALGSLLVYRGLLRGGWRNTGTLGAGLSALGLALAGRGVTGRCPIYRATGFDTSEHNALHALLEARSASRSEVVIEQHLTVNQPADKVYQSWRRLESLPEIFEHIESVREEEAGRRSHWVAKGPGGARVEWDAELIEDRPGELIAWRSVPGSELENEGEVRFQLAPAGRGTEIAVRIAYRTPSGALNPLLAKLSNHQLHEDLRRFKQWIETGEVATTEGQPHGQARRESDEAGSQTMKKVRAAANRATSVRSAS